MLSPFPGPVLGSGMKPTRSIESLSAAIDSAASAAALLPLPSSPPTALDTSLGRIQPIPSTSVLHSIKAHGSTQPGPQPEPQAVPGPEEEEDEKIESDDDEDTDDERREEEAAPESPKEVLVLPLDEVQTEGDGPADDEKGTPSEVEAKVEGSSSSSDGSEASDSDEDDDEEPTLKYNRLGGGTVEILTKDSASALAVSTKYIVRLPLLQLQAGG